MNQNDWNYAKYGGYLDPEQNVFFGPITKRELKVSITMTEDLLKRKMNSRPKPTIVKKTLVTPENENKVDLESNQIDYSPRVVSFSCDRLQDVSNVNEIRDELKKGSLLDETLPLIVTRCLQTPLLAKVQRIDHRTNIRKSNTSLCENLAKNNSIIGTSPRNTELSDTFLELFEENCFIMSPLKNSAKRKISNIFKTEISSDYKENLPENSTNGTHVFMQLEKQKNVSGKVANVTVKSELNALKKKNTSMKSTIDHVSFKHTTLKKNSPKQSINGFLRSKPTVLKKEITPKESIDGHLLSKFAISKTKNLSKISVNKSFTLRKSALRKDNLLKKSANRPCTSRSPTMKKTPNKTLSTISISNSVPRGLCVNSVSKIKSNVSEVQQKSKSDQKNVKRAGDTQISTNVTAKRRLCMEIRVTARK